MAWPATSARSKNWGTEILTDSDLESELDLLHDYINDMMNSSSGHKHDGTTAEGPKILTANINDSAGTAGDVMYSDGTNITRLAVGTAKQLLAVNSGATAPEWVNLADDDMPDGSLVQHVYSESQAYASDANANVTDDTNAFLVTEGTQLFSQAITPKATTNKVRVRVVVQGLHSTNSATMAVGLFNTDVHATNADAVGVYSLVGDNSGHSPIIFEKTYLASALNGTSATTFKVRFGSDAGTVYVNGDASSALYGTKLTSSIHIDEIKAS